MSADREHLENYLYICREDESLECTNLEHAKLYGYIAHRGDDADKYGYASVTEETIAKMIDDMGFEECKKLCIAGKFNGCFHRTKRTSTRVSG